MSCCCNRDLEQSFECPRERLANVFKNMFVEAYSFNKMSKTFKGNVTPQEVLFGEVGKLQTLLASHLIRMVIISVFKDIFRTFSLIRQTMKCLKLDGICYRALFTDVNKLLFVITELV